jgi:methionine biosynthesis protein MetW
MQVFLVLYQDMPDELRVRHFDNIWQKSDRSAFLKKFAHLKDFLPLKNGDMVLDVGGGIGGLYDSLSRWVQCDYTLLDLSPEAMKLAQAAGVKKTVAADIDGVRLPFDDNSFDMVIGTDILEHVRNPWVLLAEMARVSRKNIFIYSPNFASLGCRWDLLRGRPIRQMSADKYGSVFDPNGRHVDHIYFLTYANTAHWADKLGLNIAKSRVFWYRRYAPIRPFLEAFCRNWGEVFEIVFEKKGALDRSDVNFAPLK